MNANIMNIIIIVWPQRSMKGTNVHPILALTQPFPYWMVRWRFPPLNCVDLTLYLVLSFSYSLFISLFFLYTQRNVFHKNLSNYNLDLRSFGQLLSLFLNNFGSENYFWDNIQCLMHLSYPITFSVHDLLKIYLDCCTNSFTFK